MNTAVLQKWVLTINFSLGGSDHCVSVMFVCKINALPTHHQVHIQ